MVKKPLEIASYKSLFTTLLIGYGVVFTTLLLIIAFLSLFGLLPVNFNSQPYYGGKGFLLAIIYIPFFVVPFSVMNFGFIALGVWLFKLVYKR